MNDLSPSLQRLFRAAVRQDIRAFLYRVFLTLEPGSGFIPEWYIDAVLYQLERVRRGEIRRLIINLAPRSLKSMMASVAFPAYVLGHDPDASHHMRELLLRIIDKARE